MGMAAHAPHVRLKKPLQTDRFARTSRLLKRVAKRHVGTKRIGAHAPLFVRRGPASVETTPYDLAFKIGAAGVTLAAAILGVALGLAQPTWALAAAMLAVGALLAALVVFRQFASAGAVSVRGDAASS